MAWRFAENMVFTETDSGAVVLDEASGRYWQLNRTGAIVLRAATRSGGYESAVAELHAAYPSFDGDLAVDVRRVLESAVSSGLVRYES